MIEHDYKLLMSRFMGRDLNELYLTHSLRVFAFTLVGLFIPIYLWTKGYTFPHIILYLLLQSIITATVFYSSLKIVEKAGIKIMAGIGILLQIILFIALNRIDQLLSITSSQIGTLTVIASLIALANGVYWSSFQVARNSFTENKRAGQDSGLFVLFNTFPSIIAPLIGGIIITYASYEVLFNTALFILILSILPLFLIKNNYKKKEELKIKSYMTIPTFREGIPYIAEGYRHFLLTKLWPLFLFLIAINVEKIGGLYLISSFLLVMTGIYSGKIRDENPEDYHKLMVHGAILNTLSIMLRPFFRNVFAIGFFQALGGISFAMVTTGFMADFIKRSKEEGVIKIIYERELYLNIGRVLLLSLTILTYHYLKDPIITITIMLVVGSVSSLIMLLQKSEDYTRITKKINDLPRKKPQH